MATSKSIELLIFALPFVVGVPLYAKYLHDNPPPIAAPPASAPLADPAAGLRQDAVFERVPFDARADHGEEQRRLTLEHKILDTKCSQARRTGPTLREQLAAEKRCMCPRLPYSQYSTICRL